MGHGDVLMTVDEILYDARSNENAGKHLVSHHLFVKALELSPEHLPALEGVVRTARAIGDLRGEITHLRKLTAAAPDRNDALVSLLRALIKTKDPAALQVAEDIVRKRSRDPEVHNLYGVALKLHGRLEEALVSFRAAIRLNGKMLAPALNLGNTLVELERYPEAINHLKIVARANPKHPDALTFLARAQLASDDPEAAVATLSRAAMSVASNTEIVSELA